MNGSMAAVLELAQGLNPCVNWLQQGGNKDDSSDAASSWMCMWVGGVEVWVPFLRPYFVLTWCCNVTLGV